MQSLADTPRPSATVILAREAVGEPEIFMVRRHESLSFGAAYAFPGGGVDTDDANVHEYCAGLSAEDADSRLGVKGNGLDYYSAAVRELFEESGILLADISGLDENLEKVRVGLNTASDSWAAFVQRNELQLECGSLHYVSHWITPESQPKRYSTRFFAAMLPAGQIATHCGGELTASRWASANEFLASGRNGDLKLHFPTTKTLESVARYKTLRALMEWAQSCVEWGITSMAPATIVRDGQQEIVLPGDKDYPGAKP
jgi:8-oxo-dGTP pyrophosphatase MutT (NUDIX family)